jgi:Flp pilus assembly protein TadG
MKSVNRKNHRGESGTSLILGTASLIFLIPMVGLAVDTGFLYSAKAKMQASVDGAALAAARSLNLGSTLQSQQSTAAQNALNWFYANFPAATWNSTGTVMSIAGETNTNAGFGVSGSPAVCGAVSVCIFPDATNPQLDHVNVNASTNIPTWFMRWFGYTTLNISATGNATRRAVVVMMVLDRSGSMCTVGGTTNQPCTKSNTTYPCAEMITAAKQFTGQFAPGRDYIGLVTFSVDGYVATVPTTNFQSVLGYTNSSGSGTGDIDNITCYHGTNTAEGLSMGYQAIFQTGLPGALNVLFLETDGLPNSLALNFWDNTNTVAGLTTSSPCQDTNGRTMNSSPTKGFLSSAVIPIWGRTASPALSFNAAPFATTTGYYSNVPTGMIGVVASDDPNASGNNNSNTMSLLFPFYPASSPSAAQNPPDAGTTGDPYYANVAQSASHCAFDGSIQSSTNPSDIQWWPSTDIFGNSLNPSNAYTSVTTDAQGHLKNNALTGGAPVYWTNFHNGVKNATDNAAYRARANTTIPVYVFDILLEGNTTSPMDYVLMQRIANDPNADQFNASPKYAACASGCSISGQYQGLFVDSTSASELNAAFLQISSQILRLNQ